MTCHRCRSPAAANGTGSGSDRTGPTPCLDGLRRPPDGSRPSPGPSCRRLEANQRVSGPRGSEGVRVRVAGRVERELQQRCALRRAPAPAGRPASPAWTSSCSVTGISRLGVQAVDEALERGVRRPGRPAARRTAGPAAPASPAPAGRSHPVAVISERSASIASAPTPSLHRVAQVDRVGVERRPPRRRAPRSRAAGQHHRGRRQRRTDDAQLAPSCRRAVPARCWTRRSTGRARPC